jgi:4'-phosphopantetheinyl transferase
VTTSIANQINLRVRLCPHAPLELALPHEGEVHIWHALPALHQLDLDASAFLSPDEVERMQQFRFGTDRNNFLFCRSMLRMLLGSYLGASPAELCFAYSAHGKPSLAVPPGDLRFNVSHSAGVVLFAFNRGRRIGVDVESIRHDLNVEEIATRFFSTAEQIEIKQSPDKYTAFFHCWTRKEAFVKARGEGLSCPLDSFDVSVSPECDEVSLTTRPDSSEAQRWQLHSLNFLRGYAGAVAVEGAHD